MRKEKVTFDEKAATSNKTTIKKINFYMGLPIMMLKFRSFELI